MRNWVDHTMIAIAAAPLATPESPPALAPPVAELYARLLEDGRLSLPVLPEAAAQIMTAANDEGADARRLTDVVRRDPALASNLLRIANSSLYAPRVPIVSLQQAIARMGFS